MPVSRPIIDRFLEKVVPTTSGCWMWAGGSIKGYGELGGRNPEGRHTMLYAHRFAYEYFIGPIPRGLHLDHLCRTPLCVNPTHLEPVTRRENTMRGDAPTVVLHRLGVCRRGHRMTLENRYRLPGKPEGTGECRTCRHDRDRRHNAARRQQQKEKESVSS